MRNQLNNCYEFAPNLVDAVHNALTLLRTWRFQSIGIVAELVLIDTRCTAYRGDRCKWFNSPEKRCRINIIPFKFVVSIKKPLRHFVTIFYHSFNVELQSFPCFFLKTFNSIGCKHNSPWHVFTKCGAKIFIAPLYIYSNLLHKVRYWFILWIRGGSEIISTLPVSKCC